MWRTLNNKYKSNKKLLNINNSEMKGMIVKLEEQRKNIKDKKKKNNIDVKKILIYIVLVAIVTYVIYVIYLLVKQPTDTFSVEEGRVALEETDIGYVIRDEEIIQGENYKNGMEQIIAEGEKVAKGESVFRYYSRNEESLKQKISELDTKIQDAMSQETGVFSSDIKLIENQIDAKTLLLNKMTDISKLEEYKKEINDLVSKKAKIAGDASPKGSYLRQLIEERRGYENQLNSGAEYIKASKSGLVSYRVDGLENKLKPTTECFTSLSKQYLENLNLKTGKIVSTSDECGKIVDNSACYIATISDSDKAKEAKTGDKIKVRLQNENEINAYIEYVIQEDDGDCVIVLKIEKEIEKLIGYRKISFDLIWWSYSGLKVPNQAIVEENGLNYIVRNRARIFK